MEVIRHGDVILRRLTTADSTRIVTSVHNIVCPLKLSLDGDIVMEGELTGHAHRLTGRAVVMEIGGRRYVASGGGQITHEEHHTRTIPRGLWEIRRQREYEPRYYSRYVAD